MKRVEEGDRLSKFRKNPVTMQKTVVGDRLGDVLPALPLLHQSSLCHSQKKVTITTLAESDGFCQRVFAGTAVSRPFAMKLFAGFLVSNFWFGRFGGLRSTLSTLFINFTHKPNTLLWELALTVFDSIANWSEETTTPNNY